MLPLSDISAAIRWWAVLLGLGAAAVPLTFYVLGRLPDRGYAFSKMIGLLIVSYILWMAGSLGFLGNNLGGIFFALFVLAGLSFWASRVLSNQKTETQDEVEATPVSWIRANWRYVLLCELVFAAIFALWVWIRAQNPAITATEKPMEFAFLNSASRSPGFPLLDPWLSGFGISYYYFGYVMTSVISRLAAVPEQIGFNLAIAWLAAGAALGSFGLVYNLIAAGKTAIRRNAIILGLVAAIAIPFAGNMETLFEVLYGNGVGSDAVWEWLDIRDLDPPVENLETPRYETSSWWWWRSSRVIHEYNLSGQAEEGLEPIAEFPGFSFVLGDLHPHVLALPFAFLSLALAFAWWLRSDFPELDFRQWFKGVSPRSQFSQLGKGDYAFIGFTALILGGLSFLNTWDVLIHLFVVLAAFVLARWRLLGRWNNSVLTQAITLGFLLVIFSILLYLPFYIGFRSQAGPPFLLPMTMQPTRLTHFLIIFGMPLISIFMLVGALLLKTMRRKNNSMSGRLRTKSGLTAGFGLVGILLILMLFLGWVIALNPEGAGQINNLAQNLQIELSELPDDASLLFRLGWATRSIAAITPAILVSRVSSPALILLLVLLLASIIILLIRILSDRQDEIDGVSSSMAMGALPFALLLVGTGVLLTLGPEFVYLKDNFGQRLNTIFKFYYQAWVLFGIAALFGLDYLLRHFRASGIFTVGVYGLMLLAALLFPFYAIPSRSVEYRGPIAAEDRRPATLDGLAYLARSNPNEYDAIIWLRENLEGTPTILEEVGDQYSYSGRVSANTGLPTILGWPGHELQWRGNTPEPGERQSAVEIMYGGDNWPETAELLKRYGINYVFLGWPEKTKYDPRAQEKFDQNLELVYRNDDVAIYRWQPPGPGEG
jgi:YYY domain-containing protein